MKTEITTTSVTIPCASGDTTTKLGSLLALAAGAIAIPQTGHADIIYTDLSSNPQSVGYTSPNAFFLLNLPGSVQFGFIRSEFSTSTTFPITTTVRFRSVLAGRLGPGADASIQVAGGLAAHMPFGAAWDQGNGLAPLTTVGWASTYTRVPSGYDHEYLAWQFVDDSPSGGGAIRYGWVEISLSVGFHPVGPNVTIWGYAWDDTGAKPFMGQTAPVPEPSSAALLVFGAMALGSRGLRNWRRNREAIRNS
jgi:hypothetical protein